MRDPRLDGEREVVFFLDVGHFRAHRRRFELWVERELAFQLFPRVPEQCPDKVVGDRQGVLVVGEDDAQGAEGHLVAEWFVGHWNQVGTTT